MAWDGGPNLDWTFLAGGDLSSSQYKFVKLNASGQIVDVAAVTDIPIGILQDKPSSGQAGVVRLLGISKVQADAALTAGNVVGTSVDGQAAAYVLGTDTTKCAVGQCLLAAGAAGRIATVVFSCIAPNRAA